jgi:hypothetical protein
MCKGIRTTSGDVAVSVTVAISDEGTILVEVIGGNR